MRLQGRSTTLPQVVFCATTSSRGAMWILGGYERGQTRFIYFE